MIYVIRNENGTIKSIQSSPESNSIELDWESVEAYTTYLIGLVGDMCKIFGEVILSDTGQIVAYTNTSNETRVAAQELTECTVELYENGNKLGSWVIEPDDEFFVVKLDNPLDTYRLYFVELDITMERKC